VQESIAVKIEIMTDTLASTGSLQPDTEVTLALSSVSSRVVRATTQLTRDVSAIESTEVRTIANTPFGHALRAR
jgi:hypothetical protein